MTGLSDCFKLSSSFSLWLREAERRKNGSLFSSLTEEERTKYGLVRESQRERGFQKLSTAQGVVNILLELYSGFIGYMISISELDLAECSPMKQEMCSCKSPDSSLLFLSLSCTLVCTPTHVHAHAQRDHPHHPPLRQL